MESRITISEVSDTIGLSRQTIHSKLHKKGIRSLRSGKITYLTHKESRALFKPAFNLKKIAFHHIKGGVGKTTSTDHIGSCLSLLGARVLLIDADFQKNLTSRMNISSQMVDKTPVLVDLILDNGTVFDAILKIESGIDIIPSRFENATLDSVLTDNKIDLISILNQIIHPVEQYYDFILIDCPAMLGKLVTAVNLYANTIICPINPENHSIEGLETIKKEFINIEKRYCRNIHYKIYLNKFNGNTIISNSVVANTIQKELKSGNAYDIVVRESQEINNALKEKKNMFHFSKKSDVKSDFINLTKRILKLDHSFAKGI